MNTIVAIASGFTKSGIIVIRMSGDNALDIAKKMTPKLQNVTIKERYMYLADIKAGNLIDKGLVVYFKGPKSFTGEDVVEFQIHGGTHLAEQVVNGCISLGARIATKGEFSKRAFLNGKISLEGAEGIIDIINADSNASVSAGYNLVNGILRKKIEEQQNVLTDLIAQIDVALDYPEQDIEYETEDSIKNQLTAITNDLDDLIKSNKQGQIVKSGIKVAIVGKPNVGKSSLLNAMLNSERAIVTDIAGTTRDIIEESYSYKDIKVILTDTAGIRECDNKAEAIGIQRAVAHLKASNIILFVYDSNTKLDDEDEKVIEILKEENKPIIVLANKIDEEGNAQIKNDNDKNIKSKLKNAEYIEISAKNIINIDKIKEKIYNLCFDKDFDASAIFISNSRHLECIKNANNHLINAINDIGSITLDCVSIDIKDAWNCLGEITGKNITEDVLDAIFSKFCLGK